MHVQAAGAANAPTTSGKAESSNAQSQSSGEEERSSRHEACSTLYTETSKEQEEESEGRDIGRLNDLGSADEAGSAGADECSVSGEAKLGISEDSAGQVLTCASPVR